jgi:hypothetical protein
MQKFHPKPGEQEMKKEFQQPAIEVVDTHLVIEINDVKQLNNLQKQQLATICKRIMHNREKAGKKPAPSFAMFEDTSPFFALALNLQHNFETNAVAPITKARIGVMKDNDPDDYENIMFYPVDHVRTQDTDGVVRFLVNIPNI